MCMIYSPRRLVGGDLDSCKGYTVYSRLISILVFHLYHEHDGDAQEILIALLLKLALLWRACYYMIWRCGLSCPRARCITSSVYTLWNHRCLLSLPTCMQLQKCIFVHCDLTISAASSSWVPAADCCYDDFLAKLSHYVHRGICTYVLFFKKKTTMVTNINQFIFHWIIFDPDFYIVQLEI